MMQLAELKIWQKGPVTAFASPEPYIIGFEFRKPARVDGLRLVNHHMNQMVSRPYHVEVRRKGRWKIVRDSMTQNQVYPAFMFPKSQTHRFAPVVAEAVRIVYDYPYYVYFYRVEALDEDRILASVDPREGEEPEAKKGFNLFWENLWQTIMRDTVESYSREDRPNRFAAERKRLLSCYFDVRDRVADEILRKGEPRLEDIRRYFPPIRFGSTVVGFAGEPANNIRVDWNHALLCEPIKNNPEPHNDSQFYFRKQIRFVVGKDGSAYGKDRDAFSGTQLLEGYLPFVSSNYRHDGVRYGIELFTHRLNGMGTVTLVRLRMRGEGKKKVSAVMGFEVNKFLFGQNPPPFKLANGQAVMEGEEKIVVASRPLRQEGNRFVFQAELRAGQAAEMILVLRPSVYADEQSRLPARVNGKLFASAQRLFLADWRKVFERATGLDAPEPVLNNWYRSNLALLLLMTDRKNGYLYYGTGCTYDHSLYLFESPHGPFTLAFLGLDREGLRAAEGLFTNPYFMQDDNPYRQKTGHEYFQVKPFRCWASYFVYLTYLYTRDRAWLKKRVDQLFPRMEALLKEIRSTGKGILPPSYFGGDVHDKKVNNLFYDIQACFGLQAFGRALQALGDARARRFLDFERPYRQRILKLMDRTIMKTAWGTDMYTFILKPQASGYFRKAIDPPFDNVLVGYLAIFLRMLAFTAFFHSHKKQREKIIQFLKAGGNQLGGNLRLWCLQCGNTYHYGYRRELLLRGEKDRFLQCLYADVGSNCTRHFQGSEHYVIIPDKDWGSVEEKHRIGISELLVTNVRSLCDLFYLEEFDNVDPTGGVLIGAGVPDRWFAGRKSFGVRNARLTGGRLDVQFQPLKNKRVVVNVRLDGLKNPRSFRIRIPKPDGRKPVRVNCDLQIERGAREVCVIAETSFRVEFVYA